MRFGIGTGGKKFMKIGIKCKCIIFAFVSSSLIIAGCGKSEAVITPDGEDITESQVVYDKLADSTSGKFTYEDLTVGNLSYYMTDAQVEAVYGKPDKVIDVSASGTGESEGVTSTDTLGDEKVYKYGKKIMGFYKVDGTYRLVSVESTEVGDVFARGLKVGSTFTDILSAYYRDANCMNTDYYSDDGSTILGKFLYGNYTMNSLDSVKPTDDVAYGVISFNGYQNYESAESCIVEFTFFKSPYKNGSATTSDDFAQIAFDLDKDRKITAIRWYYYPELTE